MSAQTKSRPNWPLLMPAILLVIEIIAIIAVRLMGYAIKPNLQYIFLALGGFLVYRLGKQLISSFRVRHAIQQLRSVDKLIESGQSMAAIIQWKKLLLSLPKDKYLKTLTKIEKVYEQEGMPKAVIATKMIFAESIEFFEVISGNNQRKLTSQQEWKGQVMTLRRMIQDLPEEKE